jgi:hypothetical protein
VVATPRFPAAAVFAGRAAALVCAMKIITGSYDASEFGWVNHRDTSEFFAYMVRRQEEAMMYWRAYILPDLLQHRRLARPQTIR